MPRGVYIRTKPGSGPNKGKSYVTDWLVAHVGWRGHDCLTWPFSRVRGYGNLKYRDKMTYAHRVMCELVHGPAPSPKHHAAHSCNRGADGCVHPRHVSWKTPSQNQLDKRKFGTQYRDGRRKKITAEDVRIIRARACLDTQDALAVRFGISRRTVGAIVGRRSWRYVA